jgi:hypothetical protein
MRIRPAPAATWDLFLAQQMTSFLCPPSPLGCKLSLSARSATQSGPKGCLPRKERASARSQGSPPQEGLLPLGHPPRRGIGPPRGRSRNYLIPHIPPTGTGARALDNQGILSHVPFLPGTKLERRTRLLFAGTRWFEDKGPGRPRYSLIVKYPVPLEGVDAFVIGRFFLINGRRGHG